MKMQNTKKMHSLFALLAVGVMAIALAGCGGGGDGGSAPAGNTTTNQNAQAPASIGGKTFNGRIGGTATTWRIVFSGSGNSGAYNYSENGRPLDSGNYTYTKPGSNTGVITLQDGTNLQLNYTAGNSGTYLISKSGETGTFSST